MRRLNNIYIIFLSWLCALQLTLAQSPDYHVDYLNLSKSFNVNLVKNNKTVDSLIQLSIKNNKIEDASKISHDYSLICFNNQFNVDALRYAELAIKFKLDLNELDQDYQNSLFRAAYFAAILKEYQISKSYYEDVISLNIDRKKIAQAYCQIGHNYFLQDDFYKAINYYTIGIKKLEELKEYNLLSREYINLSTIYYELHTNKSLKLQLSILNKVINLESHIQINLNDRLALNNALAIAYSNKLNFNFKKSKFYSNLNLKLSLKNKKYNYVCSSYSNLSDIYNLERKDSALYFSEKAIKYCSYTEGLSIAYFQKGDYYNIKKDYINALKNIQKGINLYIVDSTKLYNSNVNLNELKKSDNKDQLLFILYEKIKLLRKQKYTKLALQHVLVSDSLVDYIQKEAYNTTKLHWRTKASEIYTQGAELCYDLDQPETAFYLSEKGKALLLTERILQNVEFTKLPDSIAQKELVLRKKTLDISTQEQIFEAELQYENYIDSISKVFPEHFKKLNFQNTITLEDAKKNLDNNTLVISYLWPDKKEDSSYVYALFLKNKESRLLQIEKANTLNKHIDSYKSIISKPFKSQKDKTEYNVVAYQLYKMLLPNSADINLDKKKLIIIPDGSLHNVPFEALLTKPKPEDYLIKSNTISYAYSLSFLKYNNAQVREASKDFIGYAPQNFSSQLQLNPLSKTISELDEIAKVIDGDYIIEDATKTSFLDSTKDYKVIHLATHANASDENPWIAFKDDKISLNELYTYKNNAELTVLSACESSIGEIATGEGVMSLARGFFYSGSNAVLASLWNANDKSTSFLMEEFYKHLKKGKPKSEALRTAKLNYLNTHSLSETSPYYWSSFVLIGDPSSIDFTPNYNIVYYILIILLVLIFSLIYLKRKKI